MKKVIFFFTIIVTVVILFRAKIMNFIGHNLGYGTCPNCGNSWYWVDSGGIDYKTLKKRKGFDVIGDTKSIIITVGDISHGIMICKKCLANPEDLDPKKIRANLSWGPEEIELAIHAIKKFKKERSGIE